MGMVHVTIKVSGGLGSMVTPKCCRQECNMRALNVRNITTSSTRDKSAFLSESFFSATVVVMAKDTSRPKAINIIRPNHSLSTTTTTTNNKRSIPKSNVSSSSSSLTRKPKVTTSAKIAFDQGNGASSNKPQLNIYRPPLRSHQQQGPQVLAPQPRVSITTTPTSNGGGNTSQRPKASLQNTVPRSLTTPILASNSTPVSIADRFQRRTTPTPPPTSLQQQQQHGAISPPPPSHPPSSSVMTRSRTLHTVNAILTTASDDDDEEESETDEEDNTSTNEDEDDPVINEARVNRKVFFQTHQDDSY